MSDEEAVNNMEVTLGAVLDIKLLIAAHLTS